MAERFHLLEGIDSFEAGFADPVTRSSPCRADARRKLEALGGQHPTQPIRAQQLGTHSTYCRNCAPPVTSPRKSELKLTDGDGAKHRDQPIRPQVAAEVRKQRRQPIRARTCQMLESRTHVAPYGAVRAAQPQLRQERAVPPSARRHRRAARGPGRRHGLHVRLASKFVQSGGGSFP
jgi:hypothetical protein